MKKKIKEILSFLSDVYLLYCVFSLIVFSCVVLIKVPLAGVPLLLISFVIQATEKLKERDTD